MDFSLYKTLSIIPSEIYQEIFVDFEMELDLQMVLMTMLIH